MNTRNLFFRKRRPKLSVDRDYKRPASTKDYETALDNDGFIAKTYWRENDLNMFPTIDQDLKDLEEHLMPAFWEFNQKALHHQNRFYLYQWIMMFGAFGTTFLGALTTYAFAKDGDGSTWTVLFGILTGVLAAILTVFNVLSEQNAPQKRWAKARRLTEELRTNYYRYLAHLAPYNGADRIQQMRRFVVAIRRKENENV
jgi:Protein of unknown function (DUF4231)